MSDLPNKAEEINEIIKMTMKMGGLTDEYKDKGGHWRLKCDYEEYLWDETEIHAPVKIDAHFISAWWYPPEPVEEEAAYGFVPINREALMDHDTPVKMFDLVKAKVRSAVKAVAYYKGWDKEDEG